jgi:hypothetical protein
MGSATAEGLRSPETLGGEVDPERYCAKFEKWLRFRPRWIAELGGIGTRIGEEIIFVGKGVWGEGGVK